MFGQNAPDNILIVLPSFLNVTTVFRMYQQETPIEAEQIAFSTFCAMIKNDFGPRIKNKLLPWVRFSKHSSHSVCDICSDLDKFQRTCRSQENINLCRALKYKHKERLGNQRKCISNLRHLSQTLPDQCFSIFIDGMDNQGRLQQQINKLKLNGEFGLKILMWTHCWVHLVKHIVVQIYLRRSQGGFG